MYFQSPFHTSEFLIFSLTSYILSPALITIGHNHLNILKNKFSLKHVLVYNFPLSFLKFLVYSKLQLQIIRTMTFQWIFFLPFHHMFSVIYKASFIFNYFSSCLTWKPQPIALYLNITHFNFLCFLTFNVVHQLHHWLS